MAKTKKPVENVILEREYNVPLRKGWLKVPEYKRANKAVKTLKEFIAKHMKVYDRDLRKIKIDNVLNNEIRFKGMRKPPAKIKINAKKYDSGNVRVELVKVPAHIKFERLRKERKRMEIEKKAKEDVKSKEVLKEKVEEKTSEDKGNKKESKEKKEEKEEDRKEKKKSSVEEGLAMAKKQAKEVKHIVKDKGVKVQRKALSK
jgi:ribosomal protein L31E